MTAHFYYHESARFDERDLFDPSLVIRNVITGAGDALEPTEVTLVLVALEGPRFGSGAKGSVELRTKTVGVTPTHSSVSLQSMFSERNRVTAPFLLYGTACTPVELEVRLTGVPTAQASVKKTIPFHCGE